MRRQVFLQRVATILLMISLSWLNGCNSQNSSQGSGRSNRSQSNRFEKGSAEMVVAHSLGQQLIAAKVEAVPNGDTLVVQSATQKLQLRLCGIDAPELTQPFGKFAQTELQKLVAGQEVQFLPIRQQSQQLIAEVFMPPVSVAQPPAQPIHQLWSRLFNRPVSKPSYQLDQQLVNRALVGAGLAYVYSPYIDECPHRQVVLQAETIAQHAQQGLWKSPKPTLPPWDYRRQQIVQALIGIEPISSAQAKALQRFRSDYLRNGMQQTMLAIASWYGPVLQGQRTANGETFNQNALTAAHRSLPFNTRLKVTNLQNGESVIVRINDRQPATTDLVIDLSKAAARQIGSLKVGIVPVELEVL